MAAAHEDVFDAVVAEIEGIGGGLKHSERLLDPRETPATRLSRIFSLDIQTRNAGKTRDRANTVLRVSARCIVRVAWLLDPRSHVETQRTQYGDEERVIAALMTTARVPLSYCRIEFTSIARTLDPKREWMFSDIEFSLEWEITLARPAESSGPASNAPG